ncbi:Uncharacterized conserved protein, DUF2336 family [Faunimonas pinastri]|uniref:Uncharacterized conserved protein, DUF2336 family n=1 Tax=Faunimonas pinastri TaxID=1855383 RepID=A0A1H9DBG9_9HYPH|nr:DUF2336 domain-containing protein [Faunimonas pinastri]SEQ10088.1 Uncharacterized conserved protein, DUF2336 family [Faunimonas pinastri]
MIVERFLQWTQTASVGRRSEAAQDMARAFLHAPLSDNERDGMEAAMTLLLDDPSPEIRLNLATALADSDRSPHHIILSLAGDQPRIACIVAARSPVLLDSELVDLIGGKSEPLREAIARRPVVSRMLSAALAEVGGADACLQLILNEGARLTRASLDRIVERHGDVPAIRNALLAHDGLPIEIRQALVSRLAGQLRGFVVERNWLSEERADETVRDARERATVEMALGAGASDMPALVQSLVTADQLTPALLMRALASGHVSFFEEAIACLTGAPVARVHALIGSGRNGALKALLEKARLPQKVFPAMAAAFDVLGSFKDGKLDNDYRRATALVEAVLARYEGQADREADELLALLRRFARDAKRSAARDYAHQLIRAA